jgi:hypothetical protein
MQAATRLTASGSAASESYEQAALYFQEQAQWGKGADALQQAIKALQSGRTAVPDRPGSKAARAFRSGRLAQLYRQLAYCYTKLGRDADSKKAMQQAAQADAAAEAAHGR